MASGSCLQHVLRLAASQPLRFHLVRNIRIITYSVKQTKFFISIVYLYWFLPVGEAVGASLDPVFSRFSYWFKNIHILYLQKIVLVLI